MEPNPRPRSQKEKGHNGNLLTFCWKPPLYIGYIRKYISGEIYTSKKDLRSGEPLEI